MAPGRRDVFNALDQSGLSFFPPLSIDTLQPVE
jgi:hypothetical protein